MDDETNKPCNQKEDQSHETAGSSSEPDSKQDDSSEYVMNMKQCAEALQEASESDNIVKKALGDERSSDDDEEEDEFAEAKDSVDSDVEYDDQYLGELYGKLPSDQLEDLKSEANRLKDEGNELYRNKKFKEALKVYTQALNKCPLEFKSERSILYANRAAAKVSLEKKEDAVLDCNKALELNPDYLKALLRRAQLHRKLDNLDRSLEDYKKVLELDKDNKEARQACMTLPAEINEKNEKLKQEMFGKLKELGNMVLRPFGMSTDNFNVIQDPKTGGYSINFQR